MVWDRIKDVHVSFFLGLVPIECRMLTNYDKEKLRGIRQLGPQVQRPANDVRPSGAVIRVQGSGFRVYRNCIGFGPGVLNESFDFDREF